MTKMGDYISVEPRFELIVSLAIILVLSLVHGLCYTSYIVSFPLLIQDGKETLEFSEAGERKILRAGGNQIFLDQTRLNSCMRTTQK